MAEQCLPAVAPHDACIACFRGDTPTCFGFRGSFEAHVAVHMMMGIPEDEGRASTIHAYKREGTSPSTHLTSIYLVCRECADRAGLPGLSAAKVGSAVKVNTFSDDPETV